MFPRPPSWIKGAYTSKVRGREGRGEKRGGQERAGEGPEGRGGGREGKGRRDKGRGRGGEWGSPTHYFWLKSCTGQRSPTVLLTTVPSQPAMIIACCEFNFVTPYIKNISNTFHLTLTTVMYAVAFCSFT